MYNKILTLTHPSKNPYVSFSNLITKDKFVTMHKNIKWERRNKLRGHDQNIAVFSSISYPLLHNIKIWGNVVLKLQWGT